MRVKWTTESFKQKISEMFPSLNTSKVIYKDNKTKCTFICPDHGEFLQEPRAILIGSIGCKSCYESHYNKKFKYTHKEFIDLVYNKFPHLTISNEYNFNRLSDIVSFTCPKHGTQAASARSLLESMYGCQKCAHIEQTKNAILKTRKTLDDFMSIMKATHSSLDFSKSNYINTETQIEVICPKHGSFFPYPNNLLYKDTGCPKCCNRVSSHHQLIIDLLNEHNISHTVNDRTIIDNAELDIFIPSINIAIEVNGIYWHSRLDRLYHKKKLEKCENKNIKLIQIWDYEITNKWDIIKSRILSYIGKSVPIYARKCTIKEITANDSNSFIKDNHLQGIAYAKINYGLFYNDVLVAAMTFNSPRFNKNYNIELIRYASLIGHTVVGGASRLFNYFLKNNPNLSVISYADRRFTSIHSNIYKDLKFDFITETDPSYVYSNNKILLHRVNCQKHKLKKILSNFDDSLSESENMKNNNFYKVHDCGCLVYGYNLE